MTVVWPDWSRLVNDGDAKAIGLPRSDEERAVLETLADKNERAKVIAELRAETYKIQAPSTETDKYKNITKKMLQDALAQAGIEANGLDKKSDLIAFLRKVDLKLRISNLKMNLQILMLQKFKILLRDLKKEVNNSLYMII